MGNPLRFEVTAGNINDCVTGYEILQSEDIQEKNVLADRGYDTDKIIELLKEEQAHSVILIHTHDSVPLNIISLFGKWWGYLSVLTHMNLLKPNVSRATSTLPVLPHIKFFDLLMIRFTVP
ncbi:transposase [Paenibacillus sp. sptzw28]|uniref:transposase n=1 Tax=Paenibacillus sp. sptzw28 TaxID=715179 RepID=UPI0037C76A41